tara:strand:- start:381 stop:581 length:201 start_codon:yes stop_codon:yes gene_type:complete
MGIACPSSSSRQKESGFLASFCLWHSSLEPQYVGLDLLCWQTSLFLLTFFDWSGGPLNDKCDNKNA